MKKYILLSLMGLPVIFGTTMASETIVSCSNGSCSPSSITIYDVNNTNFTTQYCNVNGYINVVYIGEGGEYGRQGTCDHIDAGFENGTYTFSYIDYENECVQHCDEQCQEVEDEEYDQCLEYCTSDCGDSNYEVQFVINQENQGGTGGSTTGGSSGDGDSPLGSSSLLPSGVSSLSGVVSGLGGAIVEFIPYVVYVGLGILGALIGFFAIRWLINRARRQSFGVFKSKRRK